jgi:hypothetical protein
MIYFEAELHPQKKNGKLSPKTLSPKALMNLVSCSMAMRRMLTGMDPNSASKPPEN